MTKRKRNHGSCCAASNTKQIWDPAKSSLIVGFLFLIREFVKGKEADNIQSSAYHCAQIARKIEFQQVASIPSHFGEKMN